MGKSTDINPRPWHRRLGLQSMRLRMMLAIAAVALFGVGAASVAIWQSEVHNDELARAITTYEGALALQDAGNAWLLTTILANQYVAAPDPALRGAIQGISASMFARFDQTIQAEQEHGHDAAGLVEMRETLSATTIPTLISALDQADSGQQEEARATLTQLSDGSSALGVQFAQHVNDQRAEVADIVASADSTARTLSYILAVAIVLMLVFAAGVSIVTARWLLQPLTNLRRTAHAIGDGDLTARVEIAGPVEVRELGTVLNSMTAQVQERDAALRQSEGYWRSLIHNAQDAIVVLNWDGTIRFASPAVERLLGYGPTEIMGTKAIALIHPDDREVPNESFREAARTGEDSRSVEFRMRHKNGEWRYVEALGALVDGDENMIVVNARDITDRKQAEQALRESEERIRSIFEAGSEGLVIHDEGRILDANPAFEEMFGYPLSELAGKDVLNLAAPESRDLILAKLGSPLGTPYEAVGLRKDGTRFAVEIVGKEHVHEGRTVRASGVRDITERKQAEDTIRHMAYHDALTGLPNRLLLQDRFKVALAQARRTGERIGVLVVDIDRFQIVNDTLGHAAGDEVLKKTASRLSNLVRDGDTVARLGSDEFMLLLTRLDSKESGEALAGRVVDAFHEPMALDGVDLHSAVSAGLSIYPDDGDDDDALTNAADAAMYAAKDAGRDTFRVFESGMSRHGRDWIELESDLRRALQMNEIVVFYQPQVRIDSLSVSGVEALARWRHPSKGLVSPAEFIPIAEETGLIVKLGEHVLRQACTDFLDWEAEGVAPLRLSVNVSVHQIERPEFVHSVAAILWDTGFPAERLDLEITETTALKDVTLTKKVADELAAMGISISIDDFGAGSTSLRYLNELPVSTLKIDQSFVRNMAVNPGSAAIASSVIALGHRLSLNVIAEGVETRRQLAFLRHHACDEFQGFLSSRPLPEPEIRQFLAACDRREAVQPEAAEEPATARLAP